MGGASTCDVRVREKAMNFDESFFEAETEDTAAKHSSPRTNPYTAKTCIPEWFNTEDARCREEDHVIFKYRADLCYHRKQFTGATQLYHRVLEVLPHTNTTVHREVTDSLTRCYLQTDRPTDALQYATQLVAPPHHNDASSWKLLALCYKYLGKKEDYVLSLQQCNLIQRYDISTWLLLSQAYSSLSTAEKYSDNAQSDSCGDYARYSNTDDDNMKTILSNTVTLFRPYFKWTNDPIDDKSSYEVETVWELLGRRVSVETFLHRLPREQPHQLLKLVFQVSACCCLIWAKQLQMYSARHSNSFARQIQSDQLSQIEDLIGCCRDDLIPLLMECFNNPPIFEEHIEQE